MGDKFAYWEAVVTFPPTGDQIDIFVDGGAHDDMSEQHVFFATVCERWAQLREEITPKLSEAWCDWKAAGQEQPLWSHFRVSYMEIRAMAVGAAEWDLGFETSLNEHLFTVSMDGFRPGRVSIDG